MPFANYLYIYCIVLPFISHRYIIAFIDVRYFLEDRVDFSPISKDMLLLWGPTDLIQFANYILHIFNGYLKATVKSLINNAKVI